MRNALAAALADAKEVTIAPNNDPAGDCGVVLTLQFRNEAKARAFAAAPAVGGSVVIDHGKHVYTNWDSLREKRSSHHPDMNPFFFPKNKGLRADYGDTVCTRTLDILRRTVYISINPDWTAEQVAARIDALKAAARAL